MYNFDPNDLPAINTLQIGGTPLSATLNKCANGAETHYNKIDEIQDMLEELEDVECTVVTAPLNKQNFLNPEIDVTLSENSQQQTFNNITFNSTPASNNENIQGKIQLFLFPLLKYRDTICAFKNSLVLVNLSLITVRFITPYQYCNL